MAEQCAYRYWRCLQFVHTTNIIMLRYCWTLSPMLSRVPLLSYPNLFDTEISLSQGAKMWVSKLWVSMSVWPLCGTNEDLTIKYPQVSSPHFPGNLAHGIGPLGFASLWMHSAFSKPLCPDTFCYFLSSLSLQWKFIPQRRLPWALIPSVSFNTCTHTDLHMHARTRTQRREFYSQI